MHQLLGCVRGDPHAEAQARQRAQEFADELRIVYVWTDRGLHDSRIVFTHKVKEYLRRACRKHGKPTGYLTIVDHFNNSAVFRVQLMRQGWTHVEIVHQIVKQCVR